MEKRLHAALVKVCLSCGCPLFYCGSDSVAVNKIPSPHSARSDLCGEYAQPNLIIQSSVFSVACDLASLYGKKCFLLVWAEPSFNAFRTKGESYC